MLLPDNIYESYDNTEASQVVQIPREALVASLPVAFLESVGWRESTLKATTPFTSVVMPLEGKMKKKSIILAKTTDHDDEIDSKKGKHVKGASAWVPNGTLNDEDAGISLDIEFPKVPQLVTMEKSTIIVRATKQLTMMRTRIRRMR